MCCFISKKILILVGNFNTQNWPRKLHSHFFIVVVSLSSSLCFPVCRLSDLSTTVDTQTRARTHTRTPAIKLGSY